MQSGVLTVHCGLFGDIVLIFAADATTNPSIVDAESGRWRRILATHKLRSRNSGISPKFIGLTYDTPMWTVAGQGLRRRFVRLGRCIRATPNSSGHCEADFIPVDELMSALITSTTKTMCRSFVLDSWIYREVTVRRKTCREPPCGPGSAASAGVNSRRS